MFGGGIKKLTTLNKFKQVLINTPSFFILTRGSEAESKKNVLKSKDKKDMKQSKDDGKKEVSRDRTSVKSKRKPNIIIRNPAVITLSQFEVLTKKQQEKQQNVLASEKKSSPLQKSKDKNSSNSKDRSQGKDPKEVNHQSIFVFKTPQTKKQKNEMIFEVERKQTRRFHHLQMCYNVMDQPLTIGPSSIIGKQLEKEYQEKQNSQQIGNKDIIKEKDIMEEEGSQIHNDSQEEEQNENILFLEKDEQNINAKEKKIKKRNKKRNQFQMLLKQNNSNKVGAANTRSSVPSVQDKALTRNQLHKKYKFKTQIKKLGRPINPKGK